MFLSVRWHFGRISDLGLPKPLQLLDAYRTTQHICATCSQWLLIPKVVLRFWTYCSVILNHCLSLFLTGWDLRLDVIPIFLDAMQSLDIGLTPCNGIPHQTLHQLQPVGYCGFCYYVSFYWTPILLGDFIAWFLLSLQTYRMPV
jgi:hypothetical protein